MVPGRCTDEVVHDQALDIDPGGNRLGILVWQVGQQPLEGEVHMALAGLGLQRVLIGHHEVAQTLHYGGEHVGGHAIQSRTNASRRCAHVGVIFSPPPHGMPIVDAGWKQLIQQRVR